MPKNLKMSLLLDFYARALTEKQREVISLYYNEDLSLAEIAQGSGITRQGVRDSIKRGEAVMTELESQLGFASWHAELRSTAEKIKTDVAELSAANEAGATNIVSNKAADIDRLIEALLSADGGDNCGI